MEINVDISRDRRWFGRQLYKLTITGDMVTIINGGLTRREVRRLALAVAIEWHIKGYTSTASVNGEPVDAVADAVVSL